MEGVYLAASVAENLADPHGSGDDPVEELRLIPLGEEFRALGEAPTDAGDGRHIGNAAQDDGGRESGSRGGGGEGLHRRGSRRAHIRRSIRTAALLQPPFRSSPKGFYVGCGAAVSAILGSTLSDCAPISQLAASANKRYLTLTTEYSRAQLTTSPQGSFSLPNPLTIATTVPTST